MPQGKVSYDDTNRLLKISGWMTDAQQGALSALSNGDDYQKAVQSLYDQPRNLLEETLVKPLGWASADSVFEAIFSSVEGIAGLIAGTQTAPLATLPAVVH